jgi:hypothetical protein
MQEIIPASSDRLIKLGDPEGKIIKDRSVHYNQILQVRLAYLCLITVSFISIGIIIVLLVPATQGKGELRNSSTYSSSQGHDQTCNATEINFKGYCYTYTTEPFLKSEFTMLNKFADGCNLSVKPTRNFERIIGYLHAACNQHNACYFLAEALNSNMGETKMSHMQQCDKYLFDGLKDGCNHIHPSNPIRQECEIAVEEWILLIQDQWKLGETSQLYKHYLEKALKYVKVGSFPSDCLKFMQFPFVPE